MKIKQNFKDIKKTEDIDQSALENYLSALYQNISSPQEQANVLINELGRLTGTNKFESLRDKLTQVVSPGETKLIIEEIKKTAEAICYKLGNNLVATPEKFKAEVKSATINACDAGALTNMQKMLYGMDNSLYVQKYDYIQNLANEYIRMHRLAGGVHGVNELIHEVSLDYNVMPPRDVHARYRNLSQNPNEDFQKNSKFKDYLDRHLSTREGVYSFAENVANSYLSNLPDAPENNQKFMVKTNEQESEQLEQIIAVSDSLNIPITSVIQYSEDGSEFEYKPDYMSIIKAAVMQDLTNQGMIEYEPLIVNERETIITYAPPRRELDEKGKTRVIYDTEGTSKSIETKNQIIESSDGWYLTETITDKMVPSKKILDTSELGGLTIDGENIEDYLHTHLKAPLAAGISFEDSLRVVIENNKNSVALSEPDIATELFLLSDQASTLRGILSSSELSSMTIVNIKKWQKFSNLIQSNSPDLLPYIARYGDNSMLDVYLNQQGNENIKQYRNKYNESLLHIAAGNGNQEIIPSLIEAGIDVSVKDDLEMTALHWAASYGKVEAIAKLIELGADINAKDNQGRAALHLAADNVKAEIIEKLVSLGADINTKNNSSNTALHVAAASGKVEVIVKLIELGADINAKSNKGNTALHVAAASGKVEVIVKLIELGADINAKSNEGNTALHVAAVSGKVESIVKLIELGADINAKDNEGKTALHRAAVSGKVEAIEKLLALGVDVNAKDKDGRTALHLAADNVKAGIIEKLVSLGADINAKDNEGRSALHLVAINKFNFDKHNDGFDYYSKMRDSMKKLIELGADINARDRDGYAALHLAAKMGNNNQMQILGALPNLTDIRDNEGRTALHLAALNEEALYTLYQLKIDINAKDNEGETALHLVAANGKLLAITKLFELGADINAKDNNERTALHLAAANGQIKAITSLIKKEAVNIKDKDGRTALHLAAANGREQAIEKLIVFYSYNIKDTDKNGFTALHLAAANGHLRSIAKSIELKADINAKDNQGRTALHLATDSGQMKAVSALIKLGADINAKDINNKTVLELAAEKGQIQEIVASCMNGNKNTPDLIVKQINQAGEDIQNSPATWILVEEIIKKTPPKKRVEVISEALKSIDNIVIKNKLQSFLPAHERALASAMIPVAAWQAVREAAELIQGNSNANVSDRKRENASSLENPSKRQREL
ncbi:MAG: ankyrin repeat domain-containing protein [Rickettsiales bacterium]